MWKVFTSLDFSNITSINFSNFVEAIYTFWRLNFKSKIQIQKEISVLFALINWMTILIDFRALNSNPLDFFLNLRWRDIWVSCENWILLSKFQIFSKFILRYIWLSKTNNRTRIELFFGFLTYQRFHLQKSKNDGQKSRWRQGRFFTWKSTWTPSISLWNFFKMAKISKMV
jgi:hypothetical protein